MYEAAVKLADEGLLKITQLPDNPRLELVCYTKQCFFGKDTWNDVTTTHRGRLYYDGHPVNKPFDKIFNVGEVESTYNEVIRKRMAQQNYEVYDKANGHLFIVSSFLDLEGNQHLAYSTKGSFPGPDNDLLNADVKLFKEQHENDMMMMCQEFPIGTWMFEAIVDHDKHSMYEQQVEQYGNNTFVLLGCNMMVFKEWRDVDYKYLKRMAGIIGTPVVKKYSSDLGDLDEWKDHSNIEGYVIKFDDGFRCKVKTTEYWQNRFKNELTADRIVGVYRGGGVDRMRIRLPEEMAEQAIEVVTQHHYMWYLENIVCVDNIADAMFGHRNEDELPEFLKWLYTKSPYTPDQRSYIASIAQGGTFVDRVAAISRSVKMRDEFFTGYCADADLREDLELDIQDIIVDIFDDNR